jgi:hypothetical protein
MTEAAKQPSTATRRTGGGQTGPKEHGPRGGEDLRGEQWHGDRGELGDGREPRRQPGGVQRSLEQVTDRDTTKV